MSIDRAEPPLVHYAGPTAERERYLRLIGAAATAAGVPVRWAAEADSVAADYIVYAPSSGLQDFTPFGRLRAVLSLWAGVEKIVDNPSLTVPLVRMVDPGLTQGMVEWCTGHVLRHHLGMDTYILGQDGLWREDPAPPLADARTVGVLGLGVLGAAVAEALSGLGFRVLGWSRRPRALPGVETHAGDQGLYEVLGRSEIVVLLLPATAATRHVIDAASLYRLPKGAVIINPGRGPLIDDKALLWALDEGQIGHATLDVFETEPLPADHRYWAHERVTVTPHIASVTRPETASQAIARSIAQDWQGAPLDHVVDRNAGY